MRASPTTTASRGAERPVATEPLADRIRRLTAEPVVVVPYDPAWPALFEREAASLRATAPPGIIRRIEHFGSTAVPGLAAKPVIDLLVEVRDLAEVRTVVAALLEAEGYEYLWRPTHGDDGPPWYAWFIRRDPGTGTRTHHVHMVEAHHTEHWDRLRFRDHLRTHPADAAAYGALKQRLAAAHPTDRVAYTHGKSAFIQMIMAGRQAERSGPGRDGRESGAGT